MSSAGPIGVFDSGLGGLTVVAAQVSCEMSAEIRAPSQNSPQHHFCVTDAAEGFSRIAKSFLDDNNLTLELVEVT